MSTPGLPRCRPSRKPALDSFVRLRKPSSFSREQREVVALDLALADRAVVDEVRLEAEDRLDVVLLAGLEQLDRAVHHAVVGEAERRLAELGRAGGELVDLARAVEQRVLGVDVQVGAGGRAHGRGRLDAGSDGAGVPRRVSRTLRETARQPRAALGAVRPASSSATAARSPRIDGPLAARRGLARAGGSRRRRATSRRRRRAAPSARRSTRDRARRRGRATCQRSGGGSAISWATVNAVALGPRRVDRVGEARGRRGRDRGRRPRGRRRRGRGRCAASVSRSASAPRLRPWTRTGPSQRPMRLSTPARSSASVTTSAVTWKAACRRGRGSAERAGGRALGA